MPRSSTRVLVVSDFHSGQAVGLTPPAYQWRVGSKSHRPRRKAARVQAETWRFWTEVIDELKPIDIAILNGDLIDGRNSRSGGVELVAPDRNDQVDMAVESAARIGAKEYYLTRGTPYHTGEAEDYENQIADRLEQEPGVRRVKIGDHEWIDVNGVIFDCKHHLGSSQVPHTRFTSLARDVLWNLIWATSEEQPKADIVIRSHVHYHVYLGGNDEPLALTTPAMQAMGTRFGKRRCSGRVHLGVVYFDVDKKGDYTWQAVTANLQCQRARATKALR